jgi:hypothetical protein
MFEIDKYFNEAWEQVDESVKYGDIITKEVKYIKRGDKLFTESGKEILGYEKSLILEYIENGHYTIIKDYK